MSLVQPVAREIRVDPAGLFEIADRDVDLAVRGLFRFGICTEQHVRRQDAVDIHRIARVVVPHPGAVGNLLDAAVRELLRVGDGLRIRGKFFERLVVLIDAVFRDAGEVRRGVRRGCRLQSERGDDQQRENRP